MNNKYTKGKWEVNPKASRNVRCSNLTVANCSSGQSGDNEEIEIANALLISKAPEMLEMLDKIITHFSGLDKLYTNDKRILENAKQLIKEATELSSHLKSNIF